jgi:hypothetical protein
VHDILRERLWRNLEALPEDRLYQVLDYIEFLNSKYARDNVRPPSSSFRRFGEKLEDKMRLNRVGLGAIKGTLQAMGTADKVVADFTDLGRSLLREVETGLKTATEPRDRTRVATPRPPRLEGSSQPPPLPVDEGANTSSPPDATPD